MLKLFKTLLIYSIISILTANPRDNVHGNYDTGSVNLIGTINVIRHGARNSGKFETLNKKFFYNLPKSQLTVAGSNQMKFLAKFFEKKYFEGLSKSTRIVNLFFSSSKPRAIFSANSFISSLKENYNKVIEIQEHDSYTDALKENILSNFLNTDLSTYQQDNFELNSINFPPITEDLVKNMYEGNVYLNLVYDGLFDSHKTYYKELRIVPIMLDFFKLYRNEYIFCIKEAITNIPELKDIASYDLTCEINDTLDVSSCNDFKILAFSKKLAAFLKAVTYHYHEYKSKQSKECFIFNSKILFNKHVTKKVKWEDSKEINLSAGLPWIKTLLSNSNEIIDIIKNKVDEKTTCTMKNDNTCNTNSIKNKNANKDLINYFYFGHQENIESVLAILQDIEVLKEIIPKVTSDNKIFTDEYKELLDTFLFPFGSMLTYELYEIKLTNKECQQLSSNTSLAIYDCKRYMFRFLINDVSLTEHLKTYSRFPDLKKIYKRFLISFEKVNNLELSDLSEFSKILSLEVPSHQINFIKNKSENYLVTNKID